MTRIVLFMGILYFNQHGSPWMAMLFLFCLIYVTLTGTWRVPPLW